MPFARTLDPSTSHQAAASVTDVTATQANILVCLTFSHTDDELVDTFYRMADSNGWKLASPSGIRSRRAELVALG